MHFKIPVKLISDDALGSEPPCPKQGKNKKKKIRLLCVGVGVTSKLQKNIKIILQNQSYKY